MVLGPAFYVRGKIRKRRWKLQHPQDYAFECFSRFGPGVGTPERILKEFPTLDDATLKRWIADFKAVDEEIWRLVEGGGPDVLGQKAVTDALRTRFPFLVGPGLSCAEYLVTYYSWHEGTHRPRA
jgi:hypothetical protein